ncbi:hypothetical protein QBC37DRAFT_337604 [Rhypophila decipiens]|uniref:Uncharacterized protein n=1 Tax=Rhypophila decipiens TaxID=261697 RepID=A0AAN6YC37_9PEZI|nr:hypothetical protein QBC37DRAFT_337604 [Rhypophila decipiens]
MHYEDIDYFVPEAETDIDSPALEVEQEKLNVGYFPSSMSGTAPADVLQMGVKARRSWERQQRKQSKRQQRHLDDINTAPHKATGVGRIPHNQGVIYPWTPEILWSLLSLATLVAIFVSLRALDGKSIDPKDWPISPAVTLNTLVALLTAICQLALVVPITQGLAQLKWNWFARAAPGGIPQRGRPLQDFALFDDAAFGTWPLAALKLLCSGKGRTLGVSACVVLLTGFLSSPFSQGAVGYEMIVVPAVGNDSLAAVLTSRAYFLSSSIARRERWSGSTDGYQDLGASQKRAIQHGIHYYTDNNSPAIPLLPPIPPQCSTPSCQFPLFSSLAVCVDTADISHRLSITKPSTKTSHSTTSLRNASLPNGAYLLGSTGTCNLNISSPSSAVPGTSSHGPRRAAMADIPTENATIAFTDQPDKLSAAIANFFFIYTNQSSRGSSAQDQEAAFSAVEVLVHFCVNTYNISVTQGVPKTELVNSSTSVAQITTGEEEGTRILHLQDPLSSSVGYLSVNLTATQALRDQLVSLIKGTYSSSYGDLMQGLTPASEVLGAALFESDLSTSASALAADNNNTSGDSGERQQHQQQKTIGNLMLNVATSLTNTIRASSSWPSSALSSSSSSSSSSSISTPQKPEVFAQRRRQITESTRGDIEGATAASTLVNGTPLLPVTAIKIHYPLMTFLTVQVLLSVAFLVGIIVQTAVWGVPVLKGSSSSLDTLLAIGPRERAVLEEEDMESEQQQGQGQGHFQGKMKEGRRRVRLRRLASTTSSSVVLGESSEMTVGGGGSRSWGGGWYLDTTATTTAPSAATNT